MNTALIFPMAAMVLLSFIVQIGVFRTRVASVKRGEVKASFYKTFQGENTEPWKTAQFSRHYANLFEMPTLFYAAAITGLVSNLGGSTLVWLAWGFVAARILHATIHLGSNRINPRIYAHLSAWLMVLAMWGLLAYGAANAQ